MKKILLITAFITILVGSALTSFGFTGNQSNSNLQKLFKVASADGLKPHVLKEALNAYSWALKHHKLGTNKNMLTIVDFSLPSYEKRMWVIDLKTDKVLMTLYTTQGKGSGLVKATHFSNKFGTDATCLGLFSTAFKFSKLPQ